MFVARPYVCNLSSVKAWAVACQYGILNVCGAAVPLASGEQALLVTPNRLSDARGYPVDLDCRLEVDTSSDQGSVRVEFRYMDIEWGGLPRRLPLRLP